MPSHDIERTRLDNGLVVVTEPIPGVASAGVTWLAPAGLARDPADRVGLACLHAELALRGAGGKDARAQADAFDALGASRATSATTLATSFRATTLGTNLDATLGLLAEMLRFPELSPEQLGPARSLCLQALESLRDDPQERVMVNVRAGHAPPPLDRSTYGSRAGLEAITPDELAPAWRERMTPGGSILAVAGAVEHAAVVDRAAALTEGWAGRALDIRVGDDPARGYLHEPDQTDQTHIAVAMDAPVEGSDESWLERVATAVLSGGMSGRLFTELRERRSLCYSVHAAYGAEADYGRRVAYVGTTPERAQESLDTLLGELRRIGTGPGAVTAEEHRRAVVGLKSRLVFSGESSGARASALAHDVRKLGHARSLEEMAERISGVTLAALNDYLSSRTLGRITVASIGPAALSAPAGV